MRMLVLILLWSMLAVNTTFVYAATDFSGTWGSDFGSMELKQTGDKVVGSYFNQLGSITGTVDDRKLLFNWKDPVNGTGWGRFEISDDGESIIGVWGLGEASEAKGIWNATRYKELTFEGTPTYWSVEDIVTTRDATGRKVLFGKMKGTATLYLRGNAVGGTLQGVVTANIMGEERKLSVVNQLTGTVTKDGMELIAENPADGSHAKMILKQEKDGMRGKWRITNRNDPTEGAIYFHHQTEPSLPSELPQASYDEGTRHIRNGFQGLVQKNYAAAEAEYRKAEACYQQISANSKLAEVYCGLGDVYNRTGQYEAALAYYKKALDPALAADESTLVMAEAGVVLVESALSIYEVPQKSPENVPGKDMQFGPLASVKYRLDEAKGLTDAITIYQEFLKQNPLVTDLNYPVTDLIDLAGIEQRMSFGYRQNNRLDDAIFHLQNELKIWEKVNTQPLYGVTLDGMPNIAQCYTSLALVYQKKLDYDTADAYLAKAIAINESCQDPDIWQVYYLAAQCQAAMPNPDSGKVLQFYEKSIQAIDAINRNLAQDKNKKSFLEAKSYIYQGYINYLLQLRQPSYDLRALEVSERSRARAFMELIARQSYGSIAEIDDQLVTPADFQQILQTSKRLDASIIDYYILDHPSIAEGRQLVIWLINPDGNLHTQKVALPDSTFNIINKIANEPDNITGSELKRLSALLFPSEVMQYLPKKDKGKLVLVPHQILARVPIMSLYDRDKRAYIETYSCQQVPGISVLLRTGEIKTRRGPTTLGADSILLMGNPKMPNNEESLKGAEQETMSLAALLQAKAWVGSEATEFRFKQEATAKSIIHLATHGSINDERPMESSIILTGGNGEDGRLTAAEIMKLRLEADLVVLSACESGLGKVSGDGIEGLVRSFIAAGTTSIVVSLWEVGDEPTKELMLAFYKNIKQGMDKAEALQKAQLSIKQRWQDPRYWAGFVLYGES